jgi:hypothetical protein
MLYSACFALYVFLLLQPWRKGILRHQDADWTFGQLLAVGIWLPPVVEYIPLAIGESPGARMAALIIALTKVSQMSRFPFC